MTGTSGPLACASLVELWRGFDLEYVRQLYHDLCYVQAGYGLGYTRADCDSGDLDALIDARERLAAAKDRDAAEIKKAIKG